MFLSETFPKQNRRARLAFCRSSDLRSCLQAVESRPDFWLIGLHAPCNRNRRAAEVKRATSPWACFCRCPSSASLQDPKASLSHWLQAMEPNLRKELACMVAIDCPSCTATGRNFTQAAREGQRKQRSHGNSRRIARRQKCRPAKARRRKRLRAGRRSPVPHRFAVEPPAVSNVAKGKPKSAPERKGVEHELLQLEKPSTAHCKARAHSNVLRRETLART